MASDVCDVWYSYQPPTRRGKEKPKPVYLKGGLAFPQEGGGYNVRLFTLPVARGEAVEFIIRPRKERDA